jgi:hypothetical protein
VTRDVNLASWRLHNQELSRQDCARPEDVVEWLGAVQAQDYPGAKWALGLRSRGLKDEDVDRAFNDGVILRTHVMRPTWHFVTPANIRWMLDLTAIRVRAKLASYYRQAGLDERATARSRRITERVMHGKALTRAELGRAFGRQGLPSSGLPFAFLTIALELDQVICSGPRVGRQLTHALFDERVPPAPALDRDEALARLTRRYFSSHGPATLRDFSWWSGLPQRDGKRGLEILGDTFSSIEIDGLRCWYADGPPPATTVKPSAHLLPNYDEYLIAYRDRGFIPPAVSRRPGAKPPRDVHPHHVVVNGRLAGSWKRVERDDTRAEVELYPGVPQEGRTLVSAALARYHAFVGVLAAG